MAQDGEGLSSRTRSGLIYASGIAIILLGAGAAMLPAVDRLKGSSVIGGLLLLSGLVEMFAGAMRAEVKHYAMAAGGITALAGLLFLVYPTVHFSPTVTLVIAWLVLRSLVILIASRGSAVSVRRWMLISAGMDFLLALLLVAGLSIAALVVSIFGPTQPLVASFAWILTASFLVTGTLLLEVASCQRTLAS